MTTFEKLVVRGLLESGVLKFYERWVDDTFVRNKISERQKIRSAFHTFDARIRFTVETATPVRFEYGRYSNETFNFLPSLDVGVYWSSNRPLGFTKVYMKPTTSKIVMPWQDFGPDDWKIGTLITFIRRAYTHSSNYGFMHEELTAVTKRFKNVGYPAWLISQKINQTLARILYKNNPSLYPNPYPDTSLNDELPKK